jgi:hypothetical protein
LHPKVEPSEISLKWILQNTWLLSRISNNNVVEISSSAHGFNAQWSRIFTMLQLCSNSKEIKMAAGAISAKLGISQFHPRLIQNSLSSHNINRILVVSSELIVKLKRIAPLGKN